ncbi:hypothetical protein F4811DRAFT_551391 [Daldinia bambusicola]|nr:hypothetical protein F4811DRAFT_551391 [Daldinia bambusicola]
MADVNHTWDNANFVPILGEDIPGITSACERLGDVLGIHDETCEEVKEHVATNYECAVLESLGITIGFPRQGIIQYLGSRPGGRRFLALVCALGTAFGTSESAQVVANLMSSHLKLGEMSCPTAEKLCPLLNTIEAQCNFSNFANHVADYEITLARELRKRHFGPACPGRLDKTPDTDAVTKLVQLLLLRKAADPAERRPKAITIQAGSCVPWLVAFLRWWLRKTPMVYIGGGDGGQHQQANQQQFEKLIQGETSIGIKLSFPFCPTQKDNAPELVRVRAVYSPSHWEDWTFRHGRAEQRYGGLVSIPTYFRLMLSAFRLDQGQAYQAAVEVVPYALSEARKSLTLCSEGCVARGRWGAPCDITTDLAGAKSKLWLQSREEEEEDKENKGAVLASELAKIRSGRFEPFPERAGINSILRLVSGCEGKHMQDLRSKQMGLPIYGHKEAAAFLGQAKHEAEREAWVAGGIFRPQLPLGQPGATTVFVEQMAHVVATILALSLFRDPERLMVRPDPLVWRSGELAPSTVISAICRVFRGQTACCDVTEWHRVCRKLAGGSEEGGRPEMERRNVIISSGGGQAVWPATIVGTKLPASDESYLRLLWCRGKIFNSHVQRSYRSVVAKNSLVTPDWVLSQSASATGMMTADAGRQLAEKTRYVYNSVFHPQSNQVLECSMVRTLEYEGNRITSAALDPTGVVKSLASAERIESCPHDETAPADIVSTTTNVLGNDRAAFPDMYLCTPENPLPWLRDWACRADDEQVSQQGLSELLQHVRSMGGGPAPSAVAVIPTAGDDRLRIFTLSKPVGAHVAIRGHACLACSVKFCKYFGFSVLVL